jgi:DNA segregation ATPase FtsK/SpoIIIE-like protein
VPAILAFPRQSSLLIEYDRDGREAAIRTVQMVMTRLLVSLPPGRVRFTIIDPVGLGQNFAGFMHLADHDEALVGGRIWTETEQIDQRLANLTEHMETVIQKYLRNEFETIDDYNAQAGELAEPYRFLVIADFPHGFQGDAFRRLASIASAGARCGVYTLVARDMRVPLTSGTNIDELEKYSVTLVKKGDRFVWKDEVFRQFPLTVDPPPAEQSLTEILDVVGRHAKDANRVEVPFSSIAPARQKFWSMSTKDELRVPVGRLGATRLQMLRLGKGVAQHALIAGKTGSGKSTLLHVLVTNLSMWYHPEEVEFYLVDFKKGVEFKTYATHELPHARAIAVESDREFGLSVLQRVDAELSRRGELYRKLGVQDLPGYRENKGENKGDSPLYPGLPRTLLIIDEFQEFFSEDDKLAQDAALLLDRLVRQGRAFGIHVLLGSQTIGGTSGLARSTIGQMAVRIALQTSEADSQLILGDNNSAARLLSRPGEAIYNDAGGLVEANSPFQIAWLPDEEREGYLTHVRQLAHEKHAERREPPVVFEGNAPADIRKNLKLGKLIDASQWTQTTAPLAWVGEPVAIKDPTAIPLRRVSGANLLVIGQQEESALAVMLACMISLAAQHTPAAASFVILDGTPADSPMAGMFDRVRASLPQASKQVEYRAVPEAIAELHAELQRRQSGSDAHPPSIYLMIYGLQRYRALRHQEESFSFSSGDEEKPPQTDKQFAELLREGPALGIHVLAWCDTPIAVERTLDRASMREFDHRILFQMSAADSSNLIDSPAAGKLGFYRALSYSEEQGTLEKFRPYALPEKAWLEQVGQRLKSRT